MMVNAISIDVEDYFHPSEVQSTAGPLDWDRLPSRVEASTGRCLDLLARHNVRGTFFVLGWVAESFRLWFEASLTPDTRSPAIATPISLCTSWAVRPSALIRCVPFRLFPTLRASPPKRLSRSQLLRHHSVALALDVLAELGFRYDSSIYPIRHDRYGIPGYARSAQRVRTSAGTLIEIRPRQCN